MLLSLTNPLLGTGKDKYNTVDKAKHVYLLITDEVSGVPQLIRVTDKDINRDNNSIIFEVLKTRLITVKGIKHKVHDIYLEFNDEDVRVEDKQ